MQCAIPRMRDTPKNAQRGANKRGGVDRVVCRWLFESLCGDRTAGKTSKLVVKEPTARVSGIMRLAMLPPRACRRTYARQSSRVDPAHPTKRVTANDCAM